MGTYYHGKLEALYNGNPPAWLEVVTFDFNKDYVLANLLYQNHPADCAPAELRDHLDEDHRFIAVLDADQFGEVVQALELETDELRPGENAVSLYVRAALAAMLAIEKTTPTRIIFWAQ